MDENGGWMKISVRYKVSSINIAIFVSRKGYHRKDSFLTAGMPVLAA